MANAVVAAIKPSAHLKIGLKGRFRSPGGRTDAWDSLELGCICQPVQTRRQPPGLRDPRDSLELLDDRPGISIAVINRRRQKFATVAVGIKQIDIIRVSKAVPPRAELDIVTVAETARDIARHDDFV